MNKQTIIFTLTGEKPYLPESLPDKFSWGNKSKVIWIIPKHLDKQY